MPYNNQNTGLKQKPLTPRMALINKTMRHAIVGRAIRALLTLEHDGGVRNVLKT